MTVRNNDPETAFRGEGSYYYFYYGVPVLRGASNIVAQGPGGIPLAVSFDETTPESRDVIAIVEFDRPLFYRQTYSFTLSYELRGVREEGLLVTSSYLYLPAVGGYGNTTVRVLTPSDPAWRVSIEPGECGAGANGVFRCAPAEVSPLAAVVEVLKRGERRALARVASLSETQVRLRASYFPGERAWASHVLDVASAGLSALERLFGFPYSAPETLRIVPSGEQELRGYGGSFNCGAKACTVRISPVVDDLVLLHELAHAWTLVYNERWLREGLAEFMARRAAERIDVPLTIVDYALPAAPSVDLKLDAWTNPPLPVATEEQARRETAGYDRSFRFVRLLARRFGMEALRHANASIYQELGGVPEAGESADTRMFFDHFDEATGEAAIDALFLRWVFRQEDAPLVRERREAVDRYEELEGAYAFADLTLHPRVARALRDWDFAAAREAMAAAEAALAAYVDAYQAVHADRSLWARFGLLFRDPQAVLDDAAEAIEAGRFDVGSERARSAEAMIDEAGRVARDRLLIALGVLAIGTLAVVGAWYVRRRRPRSG